MIGWIELKFFHLQYFEIVFQNTELIIIGTFFIPLNHTLKLHYMRYQNSDSYTTINYKILYKFQDIHAVESQFIILVLAKKHISINSQFYSWF